MERRAFISVSDKAGVVDFARGLEKLGFSIISTGGTEKTLRDAGITVTNVSDITGFPECLNGRVKTLHPAVHAGILAMRDEPAHMEQLESLGIVPIDVVCVNLYPFKETVKKPGVSHEECIENIDIGGPTMLRAAAKNYKDVAVVVNAEDYPTVLRELHDDGSVSLATKEYLCRRVFEHTAAYDALIFNYLLERGGQSWPQELTLTFEKKQDMRYGENPHQLAAFYQEAFHSPATLPAAEQLNGKELSYNNINDTNGALELLREFRNEPGVAVVAVKHANPCGVAVADNIAAAYKMAYESDPVSIFGGILVTNGIVDEPSAAMMGEIFLEIVVAPDYTPEALAELTKKKNLRVLKLPGIKQDLPDGTWDMKKVMGGLLVQQFNEGLIDEGGLKVVSKRQPTEEELRDLMMAWRIVKHTKSNAIALAKDGCSVGIGPGQVNRIWATQQAIDHAGHRAKGSAMASDAYFPFPDCVQAAAAAGITSVIHPGGSRNDQASIDAADEAGMAMVLTNMRHFKH